MFKYKPLRGDSPVEPSRDSEAEMPSLHMDVDPSQLKGLEVGDSVTVVIKATVRSLRIDTADNWGTGATLGLNLEASEVESTETKSSEESAIDALLED